MKALLAALVCATALTAVPALADDAPPGTSDPDYAQATPTLVRTVVHRPAAHRTVVRPLAIPAEPSAAYVLGTIAPIEAARVGANLGVLTCRIRRESGGHYWAANGQYTGVGQFASGTYARGVSTMPRGLRLRERFSVLRRSRVVRVWSDGSITRSRGALRRVRVLRIRKGTLRPYGNAGNVSWSQVRIMAQALTGSSAVHASEWSTRAFCG